jgi:iron(III) transport system ATP-binding protein
MPTSIHITDLKKSYPAIAPVPGAPKTTFAVAGVDLDIAPGELFFLLGPSGCGKTTLLRMIAGFIDPTQGTIVFKTGDNTRIDVTRTPPEQRDTGMVFQSYALWPHMTVAQNVAFGLDVRKISSDERERRVCEALAAVKMDHLASRKPTQLSGGQQQRVALARALVIKPRVLLLDEPLSNLDAKLRNELRTEIRRICKQSGITGIYVTHDQKEALSMADRIAVMRSGVIEQLGTPRALYRRPESRFVAEFMGEANLLECTVREGGQVDWDGTALPTRVQDPQPGTSVTACVRPEAVRVVPRGTTGAFELLTDEVSYFGEVAQVRLKGTAQQVLTASILNPPNLQPGQSLSVVVDPEDIVFLKTE